MRTRNVSIAVLATALAVTLGAAPALAAPPPNDNFASAAVLEGKSGTAKGTNVEATREEGEPNHAGASGRASVWYRWTAPADGPLSLNTFGSRFDTLLAVYTGSAVDALTEVASNDDANPTNKRSALRFYAAAGTVYSIAVDTFTTTTGTVALNWAQGPPNDDVAHAQVIEGARGAVSGTNVSADRCDVWYRWTAPRAARVIFDTFAGTGRGAIDPGVSAYRGDDPASLARIGRGIYVRTWQGDWRGAVGFRAEEGVTYYIRVGDYCEGSFVLTWRPGRILRGTASRDRLVGTAGSDIILAFGGVDTVRGRGGDDVIDAGDGRDALHGGPGNDVVFGDDGRDVLVGGAGADRLAGDRGDDRLDARDGVRRNDAINGGRGRDRCLADQGDERIGC